MSNELAAPIEGSASEITEGVASSLRPAVSRSAVLWGRLATPSLRRSPLSSSHLSLPGFLNLEPYAYW